MILLLSDRELTKLNDPLVYDDKNGEAIDTSEDPARKKEC